MWWKTLFGNWKRMGRWSFERCKNADSMLLGAIGWPGAVRDNGDLAGGEIVLGQGLV